MTGAPEDAAGIYSTVYDHIVFHVRRQPNPPLSFSQIKETICPADGSLGRPYIWAYDNINALHDVVVMGYVYLESLANVSYLLGGRPVKLLELHDPLYPIEPNFINYDLFYADGWFEEVMISSIYPQESVFFRY
jgi:hypothetical protein